MPLRPARVATVHRGPGAPQSAPVYGAGQHTYRTAKPAPTIASVPAEMTPAIAGEEAPPPRKFARPAACSSRLPRVTEPTSLAERP